VLIVLLGVTAEALRAKIQM